MKGIGTRWAAAAAMVVAVGIACGGDRGGAAVETPPVGIDLARARLVDLSYSYGDDTLYWPTSPSEYELTELAYGHNEQGYFYSAYSFCTPEHGGTHLDAPIHFAEGGRTVAEIPVRDLLAPGVVIDISERAAADSDATLLPEDLESWEARNGPVPELSLIHI